MSALLESLFELKARRTSVGTEFRGALATFLTMAYILFANPAILAAAGIPQQAALACTALAAGLSCLLMGFIANFPIALASGMGLNSVIAFHVAAAVGGWQIAMGLVVLDGLVVLALVFTGLREAVMYAIPRDMKIGIGVGIGMFIAFIGMVNAKLVVVPAGTLAVLAKDPMASMPPVTFGSFRTLEVLITTLGLLVTTIGLVKRFKGAIILGILVSTFVALLTGVSRLPTAFTWPDFSIAFQADIGKAASLQYLPLLLALIMVDFFDTIGTVTGISEQAGLIDNHGRIPRLREVLGIDAIAASIGGLLGVSSVTAYIESAAGVAEGARTGLHTVFVGLFFLVAIFFAPLVSAVPACATAPALIITGFLMMNQITRVDAEKIETAIPTFLIATMIPFTFSIAHGIGCGFIAYVLIKIASLRFRDIHPLMYAVAAIFTAYFVFGAI